MLKYLWEASFDDGHVIPQPLDDKYSKHNPSADHNPSAFRDILDYQKRSPLCVFSLQSQSGEIHGVNLKTGEFFVNGTILSLEQPLDELKDRKLIYYRTMRMNMQTGERYVYAYNYGYEAKNDKGQVIKKVVTIR